MSEADDLRKLLGHQEETVRWEQWEALSDEGYEFEGWTTVEVKQLDEGRWTARMRVITRSPTGRYYAWFYNRGLTEYQESYLDESEDIIEVEPREKTITIREWRTV